MSNHKSAILIRNGIVVNDDQIFLADVFIKDDKILAVDRDLNGLFTESDPSLRIIEASGRYVIPGGIDPHAFVDCDMDVQCSGILTDEEICESVKEKRNGAEQEEEIETYEFVDDIFDVPAPIPSHEEALKALSTVTEYLEHHFTDFNSIYEIEEMIQKNALVSARKQCKITEFFI